MTVFRNLATNILVFIINIIIGLWLPPFIISKLGAGAYGLIPLATSISNYAFIIAIAINGSVSRYLIADVTEGNYQKANLTFNTCFTSLTILFACLYPLLIIVSLNIDSIINVPIETINDSKILLSLIFSSFVIITYTSLINTSPYIKNRIDLINFTTLAQSGFKLIFIVLFFYFISISLPSFGLAHIISSIIALLLSVYFFKKQTPYLKISFKKFDYSILKEILSMGSWLLVSQIGALLFLHIDLLLINVFEGAEKAGRYSILLPWNILIRTFAAVIAGVIAPIILQYYAQKNIKAIIELSAISVKVLGVLISLIVGLISAYSSQILTLWVGAEFSYLSTLFIMLIFHLGINLSVLPLYSITNAYKKVKIPGLVTIGLGIINVLLAIYFLKYTNLDLMGVALAGFIVLTFKNIFFAPIYTAKVLELKWTYFIKYSLTSIIVLLFSYIIGKQYSNFFCVDKWSDLIIALLICGMLSLIITYFVIFRNSEKRKIRNLIKFI